MSSRADPHSNTHRTAPQGPKLLYYHTLWGYGGLFVPFAVAVCNVNRRPGGFVWPDSAVPLGRHRQRRRPGAAPCARVARRWLAAWA